MINANFTLVDAYARTSTKVNKGTTVVMSEAVTEAGELLADWMAVTLMGCVKTTFSQDQVESEAIEAGANVDAGATLHVRLDDGTMGAIKIPAIDPDLVKVDGKVDVEAQAILDLVANYEQAGNYRLSKGNYVTALLYGELDR